jgi:transcriptional regulator with XRE-family HTH domain
MVTTPESQHPVHGLGSEPVIDTNFAARLAATREAASLIPQQLADRSGVRNTQICRYKSSTSQPTLDVLLALALNVSAESLLSGNYQRGPNSPSLQLSHESVKQFILYEQNNVAAFIEGLLLHHQARQALTGQASWIRS